MAENFASQDRSNSLVLPDQANLATVMMEISRLESISIESEQNQVARSVINTLDSSSIMRRPACQHEQIQIVSTLQALAYRDADTAATPYLANWTMNTWLSLLEMYPENTDVLRGKLRVLVSALASRM